MAKKLKKLENAINKKTYVPSTTDPSEELRRIVLTHKALVRAAVSVEQMASDKEARQDIPQRGIKKGEKIPNRLPDDVKAEHFALAESHKKRAKKLETSMLRELRKIPIYTQFLKHIFGLGPVVSAYLVSEIDIHKATKPSNLIRFCGLANTPDGKAERRAKGVKLAYNAELKMRLYQWFTAAIKNRGNHQKTSKYLDIYDGVKHRCRHDPRYNAEKNTWEGRTGGAKGFINEKARRKATDVLIEDLYIVWRALEGLPVWPGWYADKMGYRHGGVIKVDGPKDMTPDEALALVGDVSGVPIVQAEAAE